MRVIIAGSRNLTDMALVTRAIKESGFDITEVVGGKARGIDELGEQWAYENDIPFTGKPANWDAFGKSAGFRRNKEMAEYVASDSLQGGLIAIWDGHSRGTKSMIQLAKQHKLAVYVLEIKLPPARIPPRNGSRPRSVVKSMFDGD